MIGSTFTKHARNRSTARRIPPGIADLIVEYGEARHVRDGAESYVLGKTGFRTVRRLYGPGVAKALQPYRLAYVVVSNGCVLTVAFAREGRHLRRRQDSQ